MKKPFIVANVREVLDLYDNGKITFSRMVEMLNEIADMFYEPKEVRPSYEKDCDNCRHYGLSPSLEPCLSCCQSDNPWGKWERIIT